jgi:uncharacterized membrane protein YczE
MIKLSDKNVPEALREIKSLLTPSNLFRYILGMIIIGMGVGLMVRSNVGVSSWDTLNYALMNLLHIEFGLASGLTATIVLILTVILYNNIVYVIMIVPIVLVSLFIILFDSYIYIDLVYTEHWQHIIGFVSGMFLLPLGGSLLISTGLPAAVYDEFMLAFLKKLKSSNIPKVRAIIELSVVLTALFVGVIAGIGKGRIGIGTLIFALLIGVFIKLYLKLFERLGIYEN